MGLKIYYGRNGTLRPTWWATVVYKGQQRSKNLGVKIAGDVPTDENGKTALAIKGDAAFERSRAAAQRALDAWRREMRVNPAELQESAYRAHTGVSLAGVPFAKLIDKWLALKRQNAPTAERVRSTRLTFKRFGDFARAFAAARGRRCETLNDITPEIAAAWFEKVKGEFAWATVKDIMHLLSGAFKRWATNGQSNPFSDILLRGNKAAGEERKRTERKALTDKQFSRLLDCAKENERLFPLVVCAAFTGMRLGDVCRLRVADVDLDNGEIDCVTAKAGVRVRIPILSPILRKVLEENRTTIIRSVKPYFARAVFGDAQPEEEAQEIDQNGKEETPPDIETEAARAGWQEGKRARVVEVYRRFKAGEPSCAIAEAMKLARGQVSCYLRDAEELTGETLRPMAAKKAKPCAVELIKKTRVKRTVGKHSASIWGWHNLRHNFITCALNNGVPIHKVAAIVGHGTTEITAGYADTQTDTRKATTALEPIRKKSAVDDFISRLTDEQRKELARKLLDL